MLTMDALWRETAATSRIQVTQELNRSSSRGSAVLHKSVDPRHLAHVFRDRCLAALRDGDFLYVNRVVDAHSELFSILQIMARG